MKRIYLILSLLIVFGIGNAPFVSAQSNESLLGQFDRSWELTPGYYRVMKHGLVGVATRQKVVVPVDYQQVWSMSEKGFIRVMKDGKTGLCHVERGIIIPTQYDQVGEILNGRIKVLRDGKVGYYGVNGQVIVPAEYDQIWEFENGMARVFKKGRIGYINEAGYEIIPCNYQQIWEFNNGMARVLRDGKIGFVNANGVEIIPCAYQQIWEFKQGRARMIKEGKIGYVDDKGIEEIPPIFSQIYDFENDTAKAVLDGQLVLINTQGEVIEVITDQWISATDNSNSSDKATIEKDVNTTMVVDSGRTIRLGDNVIAFSKKNGESIVEFKQKTNNEEATIKPKRKSFNSHLQGVDIGFNQFLNSDRTTNSPSNYNFLELNTSKSIGITIYPYKENIELEPSGHIGLVTALGLEFNNYRFDTPNLLNINDEGVLTSTLFTTGSVEKYKLTTLHLTLPVLLEFQIPSQSKDRVYVSGGVIGGVRLRSHTKLVYNTNSGGREKEKQRDDYGLSSLRYGVMGKVGYKFINLYGVYYLTPLFSGVGTPDLFPFSVGISFHPD